MPEDRNLYTSNRTFLVRYSGECVLTVREIWPEGDAPADPTPEDVIDAMHDNLAEADEGRHVTPRSKFDSDDGWLLHEWTLTAGPATLSVDGVPLGPERLRSSFEEHYELTDEDGDDLFANWTCREGHAGRDFSSGKRHFLDTGHFITFSGAKSQVSADPDGE